MAKQRIISDKEAIGLMAKFVSSVSEEEFFTEMNESGYDILLDFSSDDFLEPGYQIVTVCQQENPNIIVVLNRGLSWHHQTLKGFLQEWPDISAAFASKPPVESDILPKKISDIRDKKIVEEMTIIGHSRGALAVQHNADVSCINYPNTRLIAVDSPGIKGLKVQNPNTVGYKALPNAINCWGDFAFEENHVILNHTKFTEKGFFQASCDLHGIKGIYDNFEKQQPLKQPYTFELAYMTFCTLGGKMGFISSSMLLFSGLALQNSIMSEEHYAASLLPCVEESKDEVELFGSSEGCWI